LRGFSLLEGSFRKERDGLSKLSRKVDGRLKAGNLYGRVNDWEMGAGRYTSLKNERLQNCSNGLVPKIYCKLYSRFFTVRRKRIIISESIIYII